MDPQIFVTNPDPSFNRVPDPAKSFGSGSTMQMFTFLSLGQTRHPISLAITDVVYPDLQGSETFCRIRIRDSGLWTAL
jgi:hypothetical protein